MLYFANPCGSDNVIAAMKDLGTGVGFINTRTQGNRMPAHVQWCADNECFMEEKFDGDKFLAWLAKFTSVERINCKFVVIPDRVGDPVATLERFQEFGPTIRDMGFPIAFVGQDGIENMLDQVPWYMFDAWFTGGSTEWKLSTGAHDAMLKAKQQGKWCHMGRVNSRKRVLLAARDGYDSVDGTYLTFGPDINLPKLLKWLKEANTQTSTSAFQDQP